MSKFAPPELVRATAERLARALDAEDYGAARALLGDQCVYLVHDERHVGPDAIIESYQGVGNWAARTLDQIDYESSVRLMEDGRAVVTYVDHLRHGNHRLRHSCEQILEIGADGRVHSIEHCDLPGESEALQEFFEKAGLSARQRRSEEA